MGLGLSVKQEETLARLIAIYNALTEQNLEKYLCFGEGMVAASNPPRGE